jgi:hypothetical protein
MNSCSTRAAFLPVLVFLWARISFFEGHHTNHERAATSGPFMVEVSPFRPFLWRRLESPSQREVFRSNSTALGSARPINEATSGLCSDV